MKDLRVIAMAFICGCTMGSFLYCVCDRTIREESLLYRSRCPECTHVLSLPDLIPVLSFLLLKGRCRYCNGRIDPICFYAELISGLLYVPVFLRFSEIRELTVYLAMINAMLLIAMFDVRSMLIPDFMLVLLFVCRIFCFFLLKEDPGAFLDRLAGSFLLAVSLYVFVFFSERIAGKEVMGKGDILLILPLGSSVGIPENLMALFMSCMSAFVYGMACIKKKQRRCIPFAPAICLAYLTMFLYGNRVMDLYLSLFQK